MADAFLDQNHHPDILKEPRRPTKTPLRLKYEAEASSIQKKLGSLEEIRQGLGLSQRKISQLLLVDPSAWTRWTKGEDGAPPHVYRALQWYLAVQGKYPPLDVHFWLSNLTRASDQSPAWQLEIQELSKTIQMLSAERDGLRSQMQRFETDSQIKLLAFERRYKSRMVWAYSFAGFAYAICTVLGLLLIRLILK